MQSTTRFTDFGSRKFGVRDTYIQTFQFGDELCPVLCLVTFESHIFHLLQPHSSATSPTRRQVEPEIEVKVQEIVERDRIIEEKIEQIEQQNKILVEIQITLDEKQKQLADMEQKVEESEQKVTKLTQDLDKSCKVIQVS